VDLGDERRQGQRKKIVVAFQALGMVSKPCTSKVLFGEWVTLDTRTHRSIDH
jgi:hypothetical protein